MKKSKIVEPTDKNKETIKPMNHAITLLKLALLKVRNPFTWYAIPQLY